MQVHWIRNLEELEAIADEWRTLEPPTPFQSPDWLVPWWQAYGDANRELAVLAIRDQCGTLVGLCPWYLESLATGHRLRWLGDGAVCSDHATLLARAHVSREVIESVVAWLDGAAFPVETHVELEAVDTNDDLCQQLLDGIQAQDWLITAREDTGSCSVSLPASWDEYLQTVSKNQRKRCRRWQREFFDTGRAQVDVVAEPAKCRAAFEQLVSLHNERRQATGTCGAFEDDRFRRFHGLAIERLTRRGQVQLRLLWIDGRLAATEYVIFDVRAFYAYQSGLSDAGAALSAGSLSVMSLLQAAVESGRRQVDLLRGVEPYKFSWGAIHRPAQTVVARRRTWSGVLQTCFDRARHQVRSMRERRRNVVPNREVAMA